MKNIKETILEKIQNGEIQQTSRLYFVTRDYVFYALTFLSVVLGSVAVSSILFQSVTEHIRPLRELSNVRELWIGFVNTAPYLWILLLGLLVCVGWINYKHTSRAYKKHNGLVIAVVVICSCVGGGVLFATGYSESIERKVRNNIPLYNAEIERKQLMRDTIIRRNEERRVDTFDASVRYVAPPHRCPLVEYECKNGEQKFKDRRGCGCREM